MKERFRRIIEFCDETGDDVAQKRRDENILHVKYRKHPYKLPPINPVGKFSLKNHKLGRCRGVIAARGHNIGKYPGA